MTSVDRVLQCLDRKTNKIWSGRDLRAIREALCVLEGEVPLAWKFIMEWTINEMDTSGANE